MISIIRTLVCRWNKKVDFVSLLLLVFIFVTVAWAADIDVDSDNNQKVDGANEVYGSGWNADVDAPEKDDIYDYLHQIDTDDDGDIGDETITLSGNWVNTANPWVVNEGGSGAATFTDGGILLGSGTGAFTAMAVLADGEVVVGDGNTDPVAESGATLRTSIGVGTGDTPQFTGVEVGHASDSTLARSGAGTITIEGNEIYRAGGTDVPDEDVADNISLSLLKMTALTAEPTEVVGEIYRADNDTWDPAGIDGTDDYWVVCTAADTYVALWDIAGNFYIASIELPTLEEDEWNDTAGDRLLTEAELKNKVISNGGLAAATHLDFPARGEGWNFTVMCGAAQNIVLDPNGSEQWYLNGTQTDGAGDNIQNTACTIGESITCISTERAVYCESKYTDWAEE